MFKNYSLKSISKDSIPTLVEGREYIKTLLKKCFEGNFTFLENTWTSPEENIDVYQIKNRTKRECMNQLGGTFGKMKYDIVEESGDSLICIPFSSYAQTSTSFFKKVTYKLSMVTLLLCVDYFMIKSIFQY